MQKCTYFVLMIATICSFSGLSAAQALVEKGNTLTFEAEALGNKNSLINVEWSQMLSKKSADYIQITAVVKSDTPSLTMLFIAKPLIEAIKSANCKAGQCTLKVDDRFQYGQNKEKTMRFLVLHDKSNKPFQHRFVNTSTLSAFASGAESLAKNAGKIGGMIPQVGMAAKAGEQAISTAKAFVGDPLRDF